MLTKYKFIIYDVLMGRNKKEDSNNTDISIELLSKLLGNKYQYLMVIYDVEYDHFIIEVLNPYGETIAAGLGHTLEDAIEDTLREIG